MNKITIDQYPWPKEIDAVGVLAPGAGFPAAFAFMGHDGKWFYSHDFFDSEDDMCIDEPEFVLWSRDK